MNPSAETNQKAVRRRAILITLTMVIAVGGAWFLMTGYAERAARKAQPPSLGESTDPPLPAGPSLAVLPFKNINGDSEEEFLSDGIPETLALRLGLRRALFVADYRSAMVYKDGKTPRQRLGRALGVAHLLEGVVQKLAGVLRIQARLVKAETGEVLWEQKYDGNFRDVFHFQDQITGKVSGALLGAEAVAQPDPGKSFFTRNMVAYDLFLRARELGRRYQPGANNLAIQQLQQALGKQPNYARAMAELGWRYHIAAERGWMRERAGAMGKASHWAERSIGGLPKPLAAGTPQAGSQRGSTTQQPWHGGLSLSALLALEKGHHTQAIRLAEQAVELAPNDALAHQTLGWALALNGEPERAQPFMERALRLSPHATEAELARQAWVTLMAGKCSEAIPKFAMLAAAPVREDTRRRRDAQTALILCSWGLGRETEARGLAESLPTEPEFGLKAIGQDWRGMGLRQKTTVEGWLVQLRKAGVRE